MPMNLNESQHEQPIFVIGTGRCGSTMFRGLLDGHRELLVWPFEFPFYVYFQDSWPKLKKNDTITVGEALAAFEVHLNLFKNNVYAHDLGNITYSLEIFNSQAFFEYLNSLTKKMVTRKAFLKLLKNALTIGMGYNINDERKLVVVHNAPSSNILVDFPESKIIALIRDPIDTYISIKNFYFKAAYNSNRDPCSVYRLYAANSRYASILAAAISQITFTYNWISNNYNANKFIVIKLEDLQNDPLTQMSKCATFLGIEFIQDMLTSTLMGHVHHSNLGSGKKSNGRILSQRSLAKLNYRQELTPLEYQWLYNNLLDLPDSHGFSLHEIYPFSKSLGELSILEFWKPLKHEFPSIKGDFNKNKNPFKLVAIKCFRLLSFLVSYPVHRFILSRRLSYFLSRYTQNV